MSDDFSDDDVFDNIDVNEVLQSSQAPVAEAKGRTRAQQPRHDTEIDPQLDDSLFDDIDADELIRSSQPTQKSQKRSSGAISDGDAANYQRKSTDADHLSTSKRQKTDHDLTPWQDTEEDKENVKLARRLLKKKFGYGAFRHEQEGAIRRVLAGENTLVIFPTGAGKSLCYQIPGIAFKELDQMRGLRAPGESGITIVISPLIALMKDQVDVLKRKGIAADCIDSTKSWDQLKDINQRLSRGDLQIIYCSPERLNNERFVESMKYVQGGVRLVAVDEAHCISEWGHSFRPEYLKVARFVEEIKAERVICLTATATAKVAEDICNAFQITPSGVFQTTPYRPNLNLHAQSLPKSSDKLPKLRKFLRDHPGPTLIYVTLQKESEDLAATLRNNQFDAVAFHAGMKVEDKTKVQDDFMTDEVEIVVATIAFGMGVDKSNIRNIVHYTLPATVEEYSQQVGRAGRDGRTSTCMLYLCNSDFWIRENFARGDLPSFEQFQKLIHDIFDDEVKALAVGATFKKNTNEQMKAFDIRQSPLGVIYATLELRFGLIRAITPEYSLYTFEILSEVLYNQLMQNMLKSDRPEAGAILDYARRKKKYTDVDVNEIVQKTGYLRTNLIQVLDHLDRDGVIRLTAKGVIPKFRVLKKLPRAANELEELVLNMYRDLEKKEKEALLRTREVVDLITAKRCYASTLAKHFGMYLPDRKEKCGHCTFCETEHEVELPPKESRPLDREGIRMVLDKCAVRDDPRFLARVAFGIRSPRVTELKMHLSPAWESMVDQDFDALLREFTAACKTANYGSNSQNVKLGTQGSSSGSQIRSQHIAGTDSSSGRGRGRGGHSAETTSGTSLWRQLGEYDGYTVGTNSRTNSSWGRGRGRGGKRP